MMHNKSRLYWTMEKKSAPYWILMLFIAMFLLLAPKYKALFNAGYWEYDFPIYKTFLYSSLALFMVALHHFLNFNELKEKNTVVPNLVIWLLPLSYLISVHDAASRHLAMNHVYIQFIYVALFLIGFVLASKDRIHTQITANIVLVSGYWLVIYGLLNWFGHAQFEDAVFSGRLSNVFQYPNTYAAYLMALLFGCLLFSFKAKKWYFKLFHSFMIVPILASFFLTSSRGGLIALSIALMIYLLLIPYLRQLILFIHLSVSTLASFLILNALTEARNLYAAEGMIDYKGWAILIAASIAVGCLVWLVEHTIGKKVDERLLNKKSFYWSNAFIPVMIVVLFVLGIYILLTNESILQKMPYAIQSRIAEVEDSNILFRAVYFQDALNVIKDHFFFGAGGGAWRTLYPVYQSVPYTSTQVHNFILQYFIEVGLFGFLVLMTILAVSFGRFFRAYFGSDYGTFEYEKIVFFMISVSFIIHSFIDFDMSFVLIGALFFFCLGILCNWIRPGHIQEKKDRIHQKGKDWFNKAAICICALLVAGSFTLTVISARLVKGSGYFEEVLNDTTRHFDVVYAKLNQAINLNPSKIDYIATKINILAQVYAQTGNEEYYKEAMAAIQSIKEKEKYSRQLLNSEYNLYLIRDDYESLTSLMDWQLDVFPWDINVYQDTITLRYYLGELEWIEKGADGRSDHWNVALDIYDELVKKVEFVNELPTNKKEKIVTFRITPDIALSVGKIHFMEENYEEAASVLRRGRTSNNFSEEIHNEVARWYLASLRKMGKDDDKLYQLLLEHDPAEEELVNQLLNW